MSACEDIYSEADHPVLQIEELKPPSATINEFFNGPLKSSDTPDLWELDPGDIKPPLQNGTVYHYWFELQRTSLGSPATIRVSDPFAYTVDYRTTKTRDKHIQPPSVVKYRDGSNGALWPCDIDGHEPSPVRVPPQDSMPENNQLVIYELPCSWARYEPVGGAWGVQIDVGTFRDILTLFDPGISGRQFRAIPQVASGAIVAELGINALELLPAADAWPKGAWGYATSHYYAPDSDLGTSSELVELVKSIHENGIRFFTDVVMAFGYDPYVSIAFTQFHLNPGYEKDNPDSYVSYSSELRNAWGGTLWRYINQIDTYNPESGTEKSVHPSWAFHHGHLYRWMSDFCVDVLRLDSVENIANYDFIKSYKEKAWSLYQERYENSPANFLVIGEEIKNVPVDMVSQGTLNALWNEPFQRRLRAAIIGESSDGDNFEWTVRKMINCTLDSAHPFTDGAQAVNYITSHDVEGFRKERLFDFLQFSHVYDIERRAKLAFACLLTAVGIPMILAGEEFCDQMDCPAEENQLDPVNYERLGPGWRSRVFNYVKPLVELRKKCPTRGYNDTDFIHVDQSRRRMIMTWKRGAPGQAPMVVVANFTDQETPGVEYFVENWPERNREDWREVTQRRKVPKEWVGQEPLMHWEAKIYTY